MTHDLWTTLNTKMYDYLASVTLEQLVQREKQKRAPGSVVIEDRRLGPQPHTKSSRDKVSVAV
jgi:Rrf2 family iron-sulfur cluster assembly transcriptional regulator